MGEISIVLDNEAKTNEVQKPAENESSPLFSVEISQMIQDAQKQNGFQNRDFQHNNRSKCTKQRIQESLHKNILKIIFNRI